MLTQRYPLSSDPKPETIQRNLEDLHEVAHNHDLHTSIPNDREGTVGDIVPVQVGNSSYLYIKFPAGWKRFQPS
jgi:hypothetical protein